MAKVTIAVEDQPGDVRVRYIVEHMDDGGLWHDVDIGIMSEGQTRTFDVDIHTQRVVVSEEPL